MCIALDQIIDVDHERPYNTSRASNSFQILHTKFTMKLHTILKFIIPLLLASPTFSAPNFCCYSGPGGLCSKVRNATERRSVVLPAEKHACCCMAPNFDSCNKHCESITHSFQPLHNLRSFLLVGLRGLFRGVIAGRSLLGYIYECVAESFKSKVQS